MMPKKPIPQFTPEDMVPLPQLRLFKVRRYVDGGIEEVMVYGTGIAPDIEGILKVTELVYEKHPTTGQLEMLLYVRRMFRHWEDVEEVMGAIPAATGAVN